MTILLAIYFLFDHISIGGAVSYAVGRLFCDEQKWVGGDFCQVFESDVLHNSGHPVGGAPLVIGGNGIGNRIGNGIRESKSCFIPRICRTFR